jgi:hypothetical protein
LFKTVQMTGKVGNGLTGLLGGPNPNASTDRDRPSSATSTAKRSARKEDISIASVILAKTTANYK